MDAGGRGELEEGEKKRHELRKGREKMRGRRRDLSRERKRGKC